MGSNKLGHTDRTAQLLATLTTVTDTQGLRLLPAGQLAIDTDPVGTLQAWGASVCVASDHIGIQRQGWYWQGYYLGPEADPAAAATHCAQVMTLTALQLQPQLVHPTCAPGWHIKLRLAQTHTQADPDTW